MGKKILKNYNKLFLVKICFFILPILGCSVSADKTTLDFGSTVDTLQFNITVAGPVKWSIYCAEDWVKVNPNEGSTTTMITVDVDRDGLDDGDYETFLEINAVPTNASFTVTINMSINRELELCKANCQTEFDRCMAVCEDETYPCDPVYRDNCVFGYQYCIWECEL